MKKEKLTALYERLTKLKELDEEGNVYGGSASIEADWYVLNDFLEQLPDMYEKLPDWFTAYYQVYMWEYQAFYEGLTGYYANFYKSTDYDSIQKTAKYLSENGYGELAECYNYALFNPNEFPESEKWPPKWPDEIYSKILYAEEWISNHQIEIRDFFFDILFTHQDELMQQKYFEELTAKYGDKVNTVPSKYDEETLALVPDAMKEFYRTYESMELPFGGIDKIEVALKQSEAEPFKSEGWFCFGFDGYFSFWLCKLEPDAENLSFTYWDHDSGCDIDEAIYENLTEFLEAMQEEYEENRDDSDDEWDEED